MNSQKEIKQALHKCLGKKVCETQTPYFEMKNEPLKTISFDWDDGGWNNIRMAVETMTCIAKIFNRALIFPRAKKWYLLTEKAHIFDFYDEETYESFVPVYKKAKEGKKWVASKELDLSRRGLIRIDILKKYDTYDHWHFPREARMFSYFPLAFSFPGRFFSLIKSAFRIKDSLIEEASKRLSENDLKLGEYVALHVRRNDFQVLRVKNRAAEVIVEHVTKNIDKNIPILILSDVYDEKIIELFEKAGHRVVCWSQKKGDAKVFFKKNGENRMKTNSKESIVIDMLCAVPAKKLFGSQGSTLSSGIVHWRGLLHNYYPQINTETLYTSPGNKEKSAWWAYVDENFWEKNILKRFVNVIIREKKQLVDGRYKKMSKLNKSKLKKKK